MRRESIARWGITSAAVLAFSLVGCTSTPEKDAGAGASGTGSEFDDGTGGLSGDNVSGGSIGELEVIYFDFDRYEIREDAKATLRANASLINANEGWAG